MFEDIKKILNKNSIYRIGIVSIDHCEIINRRLLPAWAKSAVIFCIPYRVDIQNESDCISEYAKVYDYHNFSKQLYEKTIAEMKEATGLNFCGFCDHSPINEKLAAAMCGLGVIGKNSLFIDAVYGSFVFLGSLITDFDCEIQPNEIIHCIDCGLCINKCPTNAIGNFSIDRNKCLSHISQKKNKTEEEKVLLKENNIVWGCDICQNLCPYNLTAKIEPLPYFKESRVEHIDKKFIESLSDGEFNKFAFAYKGRDLILNNMDFK